ncbi:MULTISPECIES: hypothetical protein [Bacillus]|uniref:Uncharacterized protein n=1 Tax=Bacillus glycinifermentans TaxID=1664069 RepID=A0A0T6BIC4_9BACI|nr:MULTISPECIES: hypothetical protein [Bacillus]KRT87108.1 hypothetical protein AB447_209070 [Bacillus glycinifermentans]MEC0342006.1 hypothetical protein [Bacillus sonorensis]MEC0457480.1 hypothetical protein [Bacillus sonorensis]MEC0487157.1 hypothetical protein [Bacillus glycinifermentans]MEC0530725.1 hypothetical protein [Bacillus sonorensis]
MKAKLLSLVVVLCISLLGFSGGIKAEAAEKMTASPTETKILSQDKLKAKKEEIAKQIKYYDENGNEIHPYTLEELKDMIKLTLDQPQVSTSSEIEDHPFMLAGYKKYNTGSFSFSYNIYLGGGTYGKAFKDPATILVTPKGTAKPFYIIAKYDKNGGAGKQAQKISLPGGWKGEMHMNFSLKKGKKYRIQFENKNTNTTVYIKKTSLWYD